VAGIAIGSDILLLMAVDAPLHLADTFVVSEHLRVSGDWEQGFADRFCHLVNTDMALSALKFAQSDMALVGEVNPIVKPMDNIPRYFTTFGDVFLLEQLGHFPHRFVVGILGHLGFVAFNTLLSLRYPSEFGVVGERMTVNALPTCINMLFVVEGQRLFNSLLTSRYDNCQQSNEQSASSKLQKHDKFSHRFINTFPDWLHHETDERSVRSSPN